MIALTISSADPQHVAIEKQLEKMSLARHVTVDHDIQVPVLIHDEKVYEGLPAIEEYLVCLQGLVEEWYECRCDKYDF